MKSLLWSFAERILPRASTAIIMLMLAFYISPAVVGVYTLAILGLTLFQAGTDNAIRQHAVLSIRTTQGLEFLRKYRRYTTICGTLFISAILTTIYLSQPDNLREQVILLCPLILIPGIAAFRVVAVAHLQANNQWKQLANIQLIAAASSLAISIPLLIFTKSLIASSVQAAGTELLFAILAVKLSTNRTKPSNGTENDTAREFMHLSLYSIIAWLQSQADRLLMGPIAGISQLGLYSVATSISRSSGDAISTSTANVLRPRLLHIDSSNVQEIRSASDRVLIKALPIALSAAVFTMLATQLILKNIFGNQWLPAMDAATILCLTIIPTLLSWSMTITLLASKRIKWAGPVKGVGVVLALPIALAASHSLELAAVMAVAREVIVLILLAAVSKSYLPRKSMALSAAMLAGLALLTYALLAN